MSGFLLPFRRAGTPAPPRFLFRFQVQAQARRTNIFPSRSYSSPTCWQRPEYQIYVSRSIDPYFNLSFEDWLFRHAPSERPLLLLYRDSPCVVIGRHQNPWKEINLPALHTRTHAPAAAATTTTSNSHGPTHPTPTPPTDNHAVPWIRRRSGGGTVYHDLGNTNFSIHLPRTSFNRHATAQIILRAVCSLGIDAHVNERNDICVGAFKITYKIVNKRAYHHGTMLISTNLDALGDLLRPQNKDNMVTKGVASVRSPVCNLQRFDSTITHDKFVNAVIDEFRREYSVDEEPKCVVVNEDDETVRDIEYIRKGMDELHSWEWALGQTPEFTYTASHSFTWGDVTANINAKHGTIISCSLQVTNAHLSSAELEPVFALGEALAGRKYAVYEDIVGVALLRGEGVSPAKKEVRDWLVRVMMS